MPKLFISDIDGCISEPYRPMDQPALMQLAREVEKGGSLGNNPIFPAFSLCSGRPFPYVECLAQVLDVRVPVLFESGGGMFDPVTAEVMWSARLTDEILCQIAEVETWFVRDGIAGTSMIFDYAKRTQAGVIGPDPNEIIACTPRIKRFVADNEFDLLVQPTHLSIDVVPEGITKDTGIAWLADVLDIDLSEIAYIGDSIGDLAALQVVGHSFAPQNAIDALKEAVDTVTAPRIAGVLEALKLCTERNQQKVEFVKTKR